MTVCGANTSDITVDQFKDGYRKLKDALSGEGAWTQDCETKYKEVVKKLQGQPTEMTYVFDDTSPSEATPSGTNLTLLGIPLCW
jgi:hypothetical protein